MPVLRVLSRHSKILFYCHFPDQLLVQRGSILKKLYRVPFDAFEEATTAAAHRIVVNSAFTRGVFCRTFKVLAGWMGVNPDVLHPCIELGADDAYPDRPTVRLGVGLMRGGGGG